MLFYSTIQGICLGQQLVKHVISRCAIATSSDDIVITALDAVHWTKTAWQAVTGSTIRNTFRTAGFIYPTTEEITSTTTNSNDLDEENTGDDISIALKDLDTLLALVNIGGQSLSANEFVEVDAEIPTFNEWNDTEDDLVVVDQTCSNKKNIDNNEEDDDMPTETPPKLIEAMDMVRRLHLLAATQQPQLHSLISQLDSQLTQLFIDSNGCQTNND